MNKREKTGWKGKRRRKKEDEEEEAEGREGLEEPPKGGWNERGEESEVLSCQEEILKCSPERRPCRTRASERGESKRTFGETRGMTSERVKLVYVYRWAR